MFAIRSVPPGTGQGTLVVTVGADGPGEAPDDVRAEAAELLRTSENADKAGAVQVLPRPLRTPTKVLLVGVADGGPAAWRTAGAAISRAARAGETVQVALPPDAGAAAVRALAEGAWLAAYGYQDKMVPRDPAGPVELQLLTTMEYADSVHAARVTATATALARDWTNTAASRKNPAWLAGRIVAEAADRTGVTVTVREPEQLAAEGFGGILAVGGGSATPPRLVELEWNPPGATRHVVLVGKGITFDTGGISIKPLAGMKLMRKDMGGAAAVVAATLAAADLSLPVRVTTLAPLAENAVSGSAMRPGDVIRHYDGTTSESTNTDAEGRLVLADALGYAATRLRPDVIVDLATLTGANMVALGKHTAALYSDDDALAAALTEAAGDAGERVWRMPLPDDYTEYLTSDIADLYSAPDKGAGSVVAALYLREFLGEYTGRWAHLDMSAPSWSDRVDAELSVGATGWGVRTLIRWLATA